MKNEGVRGKDGFIHDDDCVAGRITGTASGTGPCTCSILVKQEEEQIQKLKCPFCRQSHNGDCKWKHSHER